MLRGVVLGACRVPRRTRSSDGVANGNARQAIWGLMKRFELRTPVMNR